MPGRPFAAACAAAVLACALAGMQPAAAHDMVAGAAVSSPDILPGERYSATFLYEGSYAYHCHWHAWMVGTVVVAEGAGAGHVVEILDDGVEGHAGAMSFADMERPGNVSRVAPGGSLDWINRGNLTHNVHLVTLSGGVPPDSGAFEAWVLAGLAVAIAAILLAARRR